MPKNNKKTMNAEQNEQTQQAVAPAEDAVQPKAPVKRMAVTERRVYEILDGVRETINDEMEARIAEKMAKMEEEMTEKLAKLAAAHYAIKSQIKKQKKDAKEPAEPEAKGYYHAGPEGSGDEIGRLRKINAELRKESEGKTKTNQKLKEQIETLESGEAIAKYAEEIKRLKELNQNLRKRCVAKDKTNQNLKAEIRRLGGVTEDLVDEMHDDTAATGALWP